MRPPSAFSGGMTGPWVEIAVYHKDLDMVRFSCSLKLESKEEFFEGSAPGVFSDRAGAYRDRGKLRLNPCVAVSAGIFRS